MGLFLAVAWSPLRLQPLCLGIRLRQDLSSVRWARIVCLKCLWANNMYLWSTAKKNPDNDEAPTEGWTLGIPYALHRSPTSHTLNETKDTIAMQQLSDRKHFNLLKLSSLSCMSVNTNLSSHAVAEEILHSPHPPECRFTSEMLVRPHVFQPWRLIVWFVVQSLRHWAFVSWNNNELLS